MKSTFKTRRGNTAAAYVDINKTVNATDLRHRLKDCLRAARNNHVVLIENRRQSAKYLVDKEFLDDLVKERESILATLVILADGSLTERLLKLSKTIDKDVAAGRLLNTAEVFGK
jgi:hypothetical protein